MIRLKIVHGRIGNENSPYGIRVVAIDDEQNDRFCDVVFAMPWLDKVSKKNIDNLMETIENGFNQCSLGVKGLIKTSEYPPIYKLDKTK